MHCNKVFLILIIFFMAMVKSSLGLFYKTDGRSFAVKGYDRENKNMDAYKKVCQP